MPLFHHQRKALAMRTCRTIELEEALKLQAHLLDVATYDDLKPVAICIVNAFGVQLTAATMPGTKQPSILTAHNKAVTAIQYQMDTMRFRYVRDGDAWVLDPDGWDQTDIAAACNLNPQFVPWGGGVLIRKDLEVVGAVGISNRTQEQDHDLAASRPQD